MHVACVPVMCCQGSVYAAPQILGQLSWDERLTAGVRGGFASCLHSVDQRVASVSPAASRLLRRTGTRCRKLLYPRSLARAVSTALTHWRGQRIELQASDILLLLDGAWSAASRLSDLGRRCDCFIAQVVYDLLPCTHPECFSPSVVEQFRQWLHGTWQFADGYWAISRTVRDELYAYCLQHAEAVESDGNPKLPLSPDRFRHFQLGADLVPEDDALRPRPALEDLFGDSTPVFVSVGTIEPRKNHQWLVSAFERYWAEGGCGRLVLAGRAGWYCDDIRQRIVTHPRLGRQLFWYQDASDDEITYLYRRSRALVYPSIAEGFGLPIAEALLQGTRVLASDIVVHREVGGQHATYFSLAGNDDLVSQLHAAERLNADQLHARPCRLMPTWDECTAQLIEDVLQIARRPPTAKASCSRAASAA